MQAGAKQSYVFVCVCAFSAYKLTCVHDAVLYYLGGLFIYPWLQWRLSPSLVMNIY